MSTIIYEADNIIISSSKWKFVISDLTGVIGEPATIRINICVLINWKLKNIFQEYELVEVKWPKWEFTWYDLKNYTALNTLGDVLTDLGYKIETLYWVIRRGLDNLIDKQ